MADIPLTYGHRQRTSESALLLALKRGEIGHNTGDGRNWMRSHDDNYFPTTQVNARAFGAKGDGVTNDTAAIAAAYAAAVAGGGELYIPPGEYLGNWVFSGEAPVRGAGIKRTVLRPWTDASACVKLYGSGGDANLGATISNLAIWAQRPGGVYTETGIGLQCGDASGFGFSDGLVERLDVRGFQYNIILTSAIACNFRQIWSSDGIYGMYGDSERNVTTLGFDGLRVATCDYGIKMQTGIICTFTNCVAESCTYINLWLATGVTNGPSKCIFDNCWFEDITGGSGTRACVYLDMEPSISATKGLDVLFNRCIVSSPNGIADVHADRAQNVIFDTCVFSATADKFSTTKFTYSTGDDSVRIWLRNCGTIQELPTSTLYASFPTLTRTAGGAFGYFYEFTQKNGKRFTNFEIISAATDLSSQQVAYAKAISIDTTLNNREIQSLAGGYDGQVVRVVKPVAANFLRIVNNGTGTEKIYTRSGANVDLTGNTSMELIHLSGAWYEFGADPSSIAKALTVLGLTVTKDSTATSPTVLAQGQVARYALKYQGSGSASDQNWWEWSVGSNEMGMRVRADDGTEGTLITSYKRPSGNACVSMRVGVRLETTKGANVTAANDMTLGTDGNVFTITGNTTINGIATANWYGAGEVILIFSGTPTVMHNTATSAGYARIFLAGSAPLAATANTVLKLVYDGTQWQEVSRKVP